MGTAPQLRRDQVSFISRLSDSTDSKAGPCTGLESWSCRTQPLWPQSIICEVGVMPCVAEGGPWESVWQQLLWGRWAPSGGPAPAGLRG